MKINEIESYLSGENFSNGLQIDCFTGENVIDRLDFLVEETRGKSVLHLGFTDHLPLIEEKIKQDRWLHKRLVESCSFCVGADINKSAIKFISEDLGIDNVYFHDVIKDEPLEILKTNKIDYIILGEVLEHIDNPVEFLQIINRKYFGIAGKIIITVPNAFDYNNVNLLKKNVEAINTDHRYWFTPFTIAKVVYRSKMLIVRQGFCNPPKHRFGLVSKFSRNHPIMSETLYLIAELNGKT